MERKTVYVGNVPEGMEREELRDIFGVFGGVVEISVVERVENGAGRHAFVTFENGEAARGAAEAAKKSGGIAGGLKVGVVKKGCRKRGRETTLRPLLCVHPVLVCPEYPLNVGAVARLCSVFGCGRLCVVTEKEEECVKADVEAQRASTHGRPWLDGALVVKDLEALKEMFPKAFFAGFSARVAMGDAAKSRSHRLAVPLETFVDETVGDVIAQQPMSADEEGMCETHVFLVFGRESSGLRNSELEACNTLVTIPIASENPVLNLSHAVAVALYETGRVVANKRKKGATTDTPYELASIEDVEGVCQMWDKATRNCARDKDEGSATFRNVIKRARLSPKEAKILCKMMGMIESKL